MRGAGHEGNCDGAAEVLEHGAPGTFEAAAKHVAAGVTTGPVPARSTSLKEGKAPSPDEPEEGETSLHRWNLERPAVAPGVVHGQWFSGAG